jgi:hypothetical protein
MSRVFIRSYNTIENAVYLCFTNSGTGRQQVAIRAGRAFAKIQMTMAAAAMPEHRQHPARDDLRHNIGLWPPSQRARGPSRFIARDQRDRVDDVEDPSVAGSSAEPF